MYPGVFGFMFIFFVFEVSCLQASNPVSPVRNYTALLCVFSVTDKSLIYSYLGFDPA